MKVLLGVTGGIAAYKVAMVLRRFKEDGHSVKVLPTAASLNFVGRATWEALSGESAPTQTFEDVPSVAHVRFGQEADLVVIAPATADFIANYAHGEAKDLLSNALLVTQAPVVLAPAMHTEMWNHPATQANVATLKSRGVHVLAPAVGRLTGSDSGPGRLPDPDAIVDFAYAVARGAGLDQPLVSGSAPWGDFSGKHVVISAGGTREAIDAVRFIGNHSSGHQGFALAQAAHDRGAKVSVVAANVALPLGEGIDRIDVTSVDELDSAISELAKTADVVIMAAAVSDFRMPATTSHKLKKDAEQGLTLHLVQTQDILKSLVDGRMPGQIIVGFAAETGDDTTSALEHAASKARRKGADILVFNRVGGGLGFGDVSNQVMMLDANGEVRATARGRKIDVAHSVLDVIAKRFTVVD